MLSMKTVHEYFMNKRMLIDQEYIRVFVATFVDGCISFIFQLFSEEYHTRYRLENFGRKWQAW